MRFLSQEWAQSLKDALNADQTFRAGIRGKRATIQQVVTTPDGDKDYWVRISDDVVDLGLGDVEGPDVTVTQGYDVAVGMARREISPVSAFMSGKLRVDGNVMLLLGLQEPFSRLPEVMGALDVEY